MTNDKEVAWLIYADNTFETLTKLKHQERYLFMTTETI